MDCVGGFVCECVDGIGYRWLAVGLYLGMRYYIFKVVDGC